MIRALDIVSFVWENACRPLVKGKRSSPENLSDLEPCATNLQTNLWRYMCRFCVTLVQMSSSLYLTSFFSPEHAYREEGHVSSRASLCVIVDSFCGMLLIRLDSKPLTSEYFLPGPVVHDESLFSAVSSKLTPGTKLVSVWSWSRNRSYWIIPTSRTERGRGDPKGCSIFCFFLCSTLQRPLSLFPIVYLLSMVSI